jgi:hypothetical protein
VLTTGSALVFDGSNLGLGVTPSAWISSWKAIEIGSGAFVYPNDATSFRLVQNWYLDSGAIARYKTTNPASQYIQSSGQHQFFTAPSGTAGNAITFTQAMTLDASGQLAVGLTGTTIAPITVQATNVNGFGLGIVNDATNNTGKLDFLSVSNGGYTRIVGDGRSTGYIAFQTNDIERARIDSSGNLLVGRTSVSGFTTSSGLNLVPTEGIAIGKSASVNWGSCLYMNRMAAVGNGNLVEFATSGTIQGTISVSGTTVSYNGGHLARFAQTITHKDETIVKGTVLSNLDEMNVYIDSEGNPVSNEQLNKVKVSNVSGDGNVAGVFVNWSHDDAHNVDEINMAMTGDMIIRIAQGVTVARGDLLMSAGDGTAKPQGDDIIRAKTVAKVTSTHVTCTYEDGSYCVPCVLMAC